jgi:hypothetical protein
MEAHYQQITEHELDLACQKAVERALFPKRRAVKSDRFEPKPVRGTGVDRNAQ